MKHDQTLYEFAGGWDSLFKFSEIFYKACVHDPVLQPLFGHEKPGHVERFTAFTAETFGGPKTFTEKMGGFVHLIEAHRGFKIREDQRQRFVDLYMAAADEAGLPRDADFRASLRSHVEFGSEVATQNSNAKTDEELHPLREVPRWDWPDSTD